MGRLPQTNTSVSRYLRAQKRVVTRLANSTPYALSGTSVTAPGLMKVDERLVAGDPAGSRVELDSAGLRKYASDGTTVQVDLTGEVAAFSGLITGSEIVGGILKTAASEARVEIVPHTGTPGGEIRFYSGDGDETGPAIMQGYAGSGWGSLVIDSPEMVGGNLAELILESGPAYSKTSMITDTIFTDAIEIATNLAASEICGCAGHGDYFRTRRIFVVADVTERASLVTHYTEVPTNRVIDAAHPLFIWQADGAAGAQLQYTTDGTTWTVIGGGGGGGPLFADPNADRLAFWDDSVGAFAPLTASTGLTLTGTDLTVRSATETQTGIVELASPAETITGLDDQRATTPAGVKAAIDPWATASSHLLFVPSGALDTPTSGSATWMTLGNVTVPAWATRADVVYTLNGVYETTTATNVRAQIRVGSVGGAVDRRLVGLTSTYRSSLAITDTLTGLTPGSKSVTILATWQAAAASVRADTTSFVTAQFTFRP